MIPQKKKKKKLWRRHIFVRDVIFEKIDLNSREGGYSTGCFRSDGATGKGTILHKNISRK